MVLTLAQVWRSESNGTENINTCHLVSLTEPCALRCMTFHFLIRTFKLCDEFTHVAKMSFNPYSEPEQFQKSTSSPNFYRIYSQLIR